MKKRNIGIRRVYQPNSSILITFPFRHDIAVDGSDDFENWKVGAELSYEKKSKKNSRGNWSLAVRYDHQSF